MNLLVIAMILSMTSSKRLVCGPNNKVGKCHCDIHYDDFDLKLECPSRLPGRRKLLIETKRSMNGHIMHIQCEDSTSKTDMMENIKDVVIGNISSLTLNDCPLPDSYGEIFEHFGAEPESVTSLTTYYIRYEDQTFNAKHFNGLRNLSSMSLNYNSVNVVEEDFFSQLPNLVNLNLNSNPGLEVHSQAFQNTPLLEKLQLAKNRLNFLSEMVFKNLSYLKSLNLHDNNLEDISHNLFSDLKSLTELDLSKNNIKTLPVGIFSGSENLSKLNMNNNPVKCLPENLFIRNRKLEQFRLNCFMRKCQNNDDNTTLLLPIRLFKNLPLRKIHIENIKVDDIQDNFLQGCFILENFIIKAASLKSLPENLFNNSKNIEKINLSKNKIEVLPRTLLKDLHNLRVIDLHNNMLASLDPGQFQGLLHLENINLANNYLRSVFESHMGEVDVSNNNLEIIITSNYMPKNLKFLNLQHNRISKLDIFLGDRFHALKTLDLKSNNINQVISIMSIIESNLTNIDLSNNQIEKVVFTSREIQEVDGKTSPKIILSNNPISCDCSATELKLYLQQKKGKLIEFRDFPCRNLSFSDLNCQYQSEQCPDKCSCIHNNYYKEVSINCSNRNLQIAPTSVPDFEDSVKIVKLLLSHNNLTIVDFSSLPQTSLSHITHLDLSHNNITNFVSTKLPTSMRQLYLDHNQIVSYSKDTLEYIKNITNTSSTSLRIGNNPYSCNCDSIDFFNLVKERYSTIQDMDTFYFICGSDLVYPEIEEEICSKSILGHALPVIIISVISLAFAVVFMILRIWFQPLLEIWLFSQSWTRVFLSEDLIDKDKKYDAFISYSHHDSEYVENYLWKELENPSNPEHPSFTCKVHTRDFIPGKMIPDQILSSVHESRRTIIVLSKEYVKADWTKMEFKEAHKHQIKDKIQRVILLVHGEVPSIEAMDTDLHSYFKLKAFIQTGDQEFWKKIRNVLPYHRKHKENKVSGVSLDLGQMQGAS